ncbi:M1 family metallopeptidase [Arcicella sp. DC2W]|uniref:M1 family metallopeptidase n=1 Tax=Arcicella gelida TaxID=2984195 RepID=A0ABU5RZF6_9BACT|nr:M1 family metallopeptidase [Arcicella sp. DC2W]MEA5401448.1 M1 family metallopeptidase [Arcicella sp. DC2W]
MKFIITLCLILQSFFGFSQLFQPKKAYTRQDTLRGSITPERAWWNLQYYHLSVKVQPSDSTISGNNLITYKVLKPAQVIQIDLQNPMQITKVEQDGQALNYKRDGNAFFVELQKKQLVGKTESIKVFYEGKPRIARRPPWDGGFSWKKDSSGKWFITTSCQGLGASVWWPCKDHMYDEADSMKISITVPKDLQDISNGRLLKVTDNADDTRTFDWFVANPINNYGVNINIGNYVHFSEKYKGLKGDLDCNYYVLPEDLEKAKVQFKQVPMMLKAFEHWFGPYPFYEDGYKLVQVSYLGMEHQSSVTYGNKFANGYLGKDLSGTGWGLKWDFIIVHESGHEWFANNITDKDIADMWIHESFTNYSESLFTEYHFGKEAGAAYVRGCRKLIGNQEPIIGDYEVNESGSGDMYYKGGNMLHTIRQVIDNDEKWRQILVGLNKDFYHQTVDTKQIENYISKKAGINLSKVFDQYLRNTKIPTLEYKVENGGITYRWTTCVDGFNMPIKVENAKGKYQFIHPSTEWKSLKGITELKIDENFYVNVKKG